MEGSAQERVKSGATFADGKPVSLQNQALLEVGKEMLAQSGEVGRDICKTMITVCSGAIPVHVALIGLAVGKEFHFSFGQGVIAFGGPFFYLLAVGAFSYGYFPSQESISLEDITSITNARNKTFARRHDWTRNGMALFGLGIVCTLAATMYFFSAAN